MNVKKLKQNVKRYRWYQYWSNKKSWESNWKIKKKKEKIEEHKTKILDTIKKQEAERKAPRRVSRNSNIMQLSDMPKNDDESDFSLKKISKSRPHFSGLPPAEPKTPSKK